MYDGESQKIVHRFDLEQTITSLKWSPDDNFLLMGNFKAGVIHLRALTEKVIEFNIEGWQGKISEDLLASAIWTSDSRQIVTFSEM